MSDSITPKEENKETPEEKYVPKSAYDEKSADMHKFKEALKAEKARNNELQSKIEAEERAKLEEKQQFEELYKKAQLEKEQLMASIEQERSQLAMQRKKAALKDQLGNIKDNYLNLANIDAIEINEDGTVSSESVLSVANAFKSEYPEVLPSSQAANATSQASPINNIPSNEKSLSEMTVEEMQAKLKNL